MANHPTLEKLAKFAAANNRSVFTIGRWVANDPRFVQRLQKRIASVERDCQALEQYMDNNPPHQPSKKGS